MIRDVINQSFRVAYQYQVHFIKGLFTAENPVFRRFLEAYSPGAAAKVLVVIDRGVMQHHETLWAQIKAYFETIPKITLIANPMVVVGGEEAKNNHQVVDQVIAAVDREGIDRHSYIVAIGGGAVLDAVGYAAAIAHRGIRHIRIPTTVLSQNDSGIGVKNGINYAGKKNFLGTFCPPFAVFNDFSFLHTLSHR